MEEESFTPFDPESLLREDDFLKKEDPELVPTGLEEEEHPNRILNDCIASRYNGEGENLQIG